MKIYHLALFTLAMPSNCEASSYKNKYLRKRALLELHKESFDWLTSQETQAYSRRLAKPSHDDSVDNGQSLLPTEVCTPLDTTVDCAHEACASYQPGSCYAVNDLYQSLVPDMRECYAYGNPDFYEAGLLWNERVERGVPAIAAAKSVGTIEAKHMMIDISMGFDHFDVIDIMINEILAEEPGDLHAMWFKIMLGSEGLLPSVNKEETPNLLKELMATNPVLGKIADNVLAIHKMTWYHEFLHPFTTYANETELCGQGMHGEVTGALFPGFECSLIPKQWDPKDTVILVYGAAEGHPLDARIETTRQLGALFPDSPIIASGGAVATDKSEGDLIYEALPEYQDRIIVDRHARDTIGNSIFVRDWLQENEFNNLLLITSTYHLVRGTMALRGVLEEAGLHPNTYMVGAGNNIQTARGEWSDENQAWLETDYGGLGRFAGIEIPITFRDYSRGLKLFTKCDFEKYDDLAESLDSSSPVEVSRGPQHL